MLTLPAAWLKVYRVRNAAPVMLEALKVTSTFMKLADEDKLFSERGLRYSVAAMSVRSAIDKAIKLAEDE